MIGNTAIHIREKDNDKIPEVHELHLDIGANSKEEVEGRGIRVGHPAIYADTAEELLHGRIIGRAIDNRIGGFILSQVLANLIRRSAPPCRDPVRGERSAGRNRRFRDENDFLQAGAECRRSCSMSLMPPIRRESTGTNMVRSNSDTARQSLTAQQIIQRCETIDHLGRRAWRFQSNTKPLHAPPELTQIMSTL